MKCAGKKPLPLAAKRVYVLAGKSPRKSMNLRPFDREKTPDVIWTNHSEYLKADPKKSRVSIHQAIKLGPRGLAEFFTTGADPKFQFIKRTDDGDKFHECNYVTGAGSIQSSELDVFTRVRFQNDNGTWRVLEEQITGEEAIAYQLSSNRFSGFNLQLVQAEVHTPVTAECSEGKNITKLRDLIRRVVGGGFVNYHYALPNEKRASGQERQAHREKYNKAMAFEEPVSE